jgi:predicted MFS family arabinose efflux permease
MALTGPDTAPRREFRQALPGLCSLALASCLAVTTEMLPIGLLPVISRSLSVSESKIGLLVSLYAVMVAALAVPLTLATSRFARKPLLLTTLLCYALSNALVAAAPTFAVVAAGRTLGGVTHALFFSLCIGYAPRLVKPAHIGRALALATSGASVGFVLGVPLSTTLGTALGWRTAFAALAGFAVATLLLVAKVLPAVSNDEAPRPDGVSDGRRELVAVAASNTLVFLGQFTIYTFISVLLLSAGAPPAWVGTLLLICGACGLVGLWFAGRTLDRSPRRTTAAVLGTTIIALLVVGALFPMLVPVVIAAALWNGAFGAVPAIYQTCAVRTSATSPELAGAWINSTANLGIAGGAAIGAGFLPLLGVGGLPWVGAGFIALGLGTALVARRAFPARV